MRFYSASVVTYQDYPAAPPAAGDVTTNEWTYAHSGAYQQGQYQQYPYQYQHYQYPSHNYYAQQGYQQGSYNVHNQHQQYYAQAYQQPTYQNQYAVSGLSAPPPKPVQPSHVQEELKAPQETEQQKPAQEPEQPARTCGQCWECGAAFQDVALLRDHLALFHAHLEKHCCSVCPAVFPSQNSLSQHYRNHHFVSGSDESTSVEEKPLEVTKPAETEPAPQQTPSKKEKKKPRPRGPRLCCVHCDIKRFRNRQTFEAHHVKHIRERTLRVLLVRLSTGQVRAKVDSDGKQRSSAGFKLKLRISKVGRRGRKRRQVRIVSNEEGMSDSQNSLEEQEGKETDCQEKEEEEAPEESAVEGAGSAAGDSEEEEEGEPPEQTENQEAAADSPGHEDTDIDREQDYEQEEQDSERATSRQSQQQDQEEEEEASSSHQEEAQGDYQQEGDSEGGEGYSEYSEQGNFGGAGSGEAPSSTYQPQFESYPTSDWFSEYESGPRIVAAMAGATTTDSASESSAWAGGAEGAANPTYTTANTPSEKEPDSPPVNGGTNEGTGEDGLFSQAVLGQESPEKSTGNRQGSFEQLCLNDSFSEQNAEGAQEDSEREQQEERGSGDQQQQAPVANDLLSELEYLNNSGGSQAGQVDGSPHSGGPSPHSGGPSPHSGGPSPHNGGPSPHSGGPSPHSAGPATPSHLSSRGSNSGTPTSSGGHPTPPPSDTSFRALATSPLTSPTQGTPPLGSASATSPQQQSQTPPRLTIANNLMAPAATTSSLMPTTTSSQAAVGGIMSQYGSQWQQGAGYGRGYANLAGTSMANTNLAGPLRAPLPASVAMPYRPSPPPRIRGRPPLMGQLGRPPLHQSTMLQPARGPGRPPTSSILPPPLMPAPGGRGTMMPPLQRMHQSMYPGQRAPAPQQQGAAGKRQLLGASAHSPNKTARREDINVPSRQKDNECQIIAVANRSDGLPVIANVQGGSAAPGSRGQPGVPPNSESTINLSDSITLSVRTSSASKEPPQRGERGGPDAGAVANLLASRGITVTPAAGEREGGGPGGRDDRRLPTAQELNLSSAISVHPPTQREREGGSRERDRDGFAVPQAPASRSAATTGNSSVERPPRPPTVDLTQDVPTHGSQGTRHQCPQCDRSFPTASLLAEHGRVHQQHAQSRMPFKCHLCTAGFSTQKGQQHHYQQFHQLHLSAGDVAIPLVDLRNPVNVQRMAALGIRSFLPLTNLQNRGAGGVVGVPILTLENLRNGHMTLQQWGVSDVLSLGPAKTLNMPR